MSAPFTSNLHRLANRHFSTRAFVWQKKVHSSGVSPSERAAGKAARTAKMGGKRDTKAAKAKRAERRGKGALKTEQKTAIAEGKQERKKAFAKDEEDLDALQHSQSAARALCQLGSCAS